MTTIINPILRRARIEPLAHRVTYSLTGWTITRVIDDGESLTSLVTAEEAAQVMDWIEEERESLWPNAQNWVEEGM